MNISIIPQYYAQKVGLVNFKDFKAHYHRRNDENHTITFEDIVSRIDNVVEKRNGVRAKFEDGSAIFVGFDGSYIRYNRLGHKQSIRTAGSVKGMCFENYHVYITVYNKDISLERFVAVCRDILNDTLLVNYSELTANVMDGSGSLKTAEYLKIPYNISFDNVEWCSRGQNASHGQKIKKLYEITEHVYRFSAEDDELDSVFRSKDPKLIKEYCQNNLFEVK